MSDPLIAVVDYLTPLVGVPVFAQRIPDSPDLCVAVSWVGTGGGDHDRVMNGPHPVRSRVGMHVLCRGMDYADAFVVLENAVLQLELAGSVDCGDGRVIGEMRRTGMPVLNEVDGDGREILVSQLEVELWGSQ